MAILGIGNKETQWPAPVHPSPMFPHYGSRQGRYLHLYAPGFSDDAATGMAIIINAAAGNDMTSIEYVNKAGVVQWTKAISDFTDSNKIAGMYMDDNDECLYLVVTNTDTAPDNYKLVSVDKEGTVTQSFGWTTPSGTSFDFEYDGWNSTFGSLHRSGGDGSGSFDMYHAGAVISTADGATPGTYRMVKMSFAAADGALTETVVLPDTAAGDQSHTNHTPNLGPTSNNIVGGLRLRDPDTTSRELSGPLINTSTGNMVAHAHYPMNIGSPHIYDNSRQYQSIVNRWRGYYGIGFIYNHGGGYFFTEASIHTMIDELAVKHGIL